MKTKVSCIIRKCDNGFTEDDMCAADVINNKIQFILDTVFYRKRINNYKYELFKYLNKINLFTEFTIDML